MTIFFSINSYGKYYKNVQLQSKNNILNPLVLIEKDETININSIESNIYNFIVRNYNNESVNRINIKYYIEIQLETDALIKIYKNNQEIKINNKKTEKYLLSGKTKQEDFYKIEISFLNISKQEIADEIKVKVYFEQEER